MECGAKEGDARTGLSFTAMIHSHCGVYTGLDGFHIKIHHSNKLLTN